MGFPASLAGAALTMLSAAIAALVLWLSFGSSWTHPDGRVTAVSNALPGGIPRLSLAVLPLPPIGGSSDQPNLADGVTENLTAELSRYTDLRVTLQQTAVALQLKALGARDIGRRSCVHGRHRHGASGFRLSRNRPRRPTEPASAPG